MGKRVIVLVIVGLLILGGGVLANDAGPYIDDSNLLLDAEIISHDEGLRIGRTFDFTLRVTNRTNQAIQIIEIVTLYGKSSNEYLDSVRFEGDDHIYPVIPPYRTIDIECSSHIDTSVYWYHSNFDLGYFAKLQPLIKYNFLDGDDFYDYYYTKASSAKHIPILNIQDGSQLINISALPATPKFTYYERYYVTSSSNAMLGEQYETLVIENISDHDIQDIYVQNTRKSNTISLNASESLALPLLYTDWIQESNIQEELILHLSALFQYKGEYYGVHIRKDYETQILHTPDLHIWTENVNNEYLLHIQNESDEVYNNLFVSTDGYPDWVDPAFVRSQLVPGEVWTMLFSNAKEAYSISVGYLIDSYLYHWNYDCDRLYPFDTDDVSPILSIDPRQPLMIDFDIAMLDSSHTPQPIVDKPNPIPTDSPTPPTTPAPSSQTESDVEQDLNNNTTQNHDENSNHIQINETHLLPIVPYWVWFILGGLLITTWLIAYIIKRRRQNHE